MLWHQRIGHINNNSLNKLNIIKTLNSLNYKYKEYILIKSKRHPNHKISGNKPTKYLELIQSDLF